MKKWLEIKDKDGNTIAWEGNPEHRKAMNKNINDLLNTKLGTQEHNMAMYELHKMIDDEVNEMEDYMRRKITNIGE